MRLRCLQINLKEVQIHVQTAITLYSYVNVKDKNTLRRPLVLGLEEVFYGCGSDKDVIASKDLRFFW